MDPRNSGYNKVDESMRILGMSLDWVTSRGVKVALTGVPHYGQYTGQYAVTPNEVLARVTAEHGVAYLNSYEALADLIRGSKQSDYY